MSKISSPFPALLSSYLLRDSWQLGLKAGLLWLTFVPALAPFCIQPGFLYQDSSLRKTAASDAARGHSLLFFPREGPALDLKV